MGHSCEGQGGRNYSKSRSVQKRSQFRTSHGHVSSYVENGIKTPPFSVECRSAAERVLVSSSRGHWQSNTQNQEIKNDRELTGCLWGLLLLRLVRLSYAIRQQRSSAKKTPVITERRKQKVFSVPLDHRPLPKPAPAFSVQGQRHDVITQGSGERKGGGGKNGPFQFGPIREWARLWWAGLYAAT